ncbi:MAG: hypothetical protein ACOYMG_24480 [Candidatus Methylumidiphilus sp.]
MSGDYGNDQKSLCPHKKHFSRPTKIPNASKILISLPGKLLGKGKIRFSVRRKGFSAFHENLF